MPNAVRAFRFSNDRIICTLLDHDSGFCEGVSSAFIFCNAVRTTIMTTLQAFLLGVLQGVTEFFPVSSSGHLVLAEHFLHINTDPVSMQAFNILLHTGTLLALLWCYRERWWCLLACLWTRDGAHRRLLTLLIIATIPAAVAGVLLEDIIALHFSSPRSIAFSFVITAMVLLLGERSKQMRSAEHLTIGQACWIGVAQACALLPGLSRSGLTISAGRAAGLHRREAVDFSFLMSAPIIAGATLISSTSVITGEAILPPMPAVTIGVLSSFIMSILAIRFLRHFALHWSMAWFSAYLSVAAALLLIQV